MNGLEFFDWMQKENKKEDKEAEAKEWREIWGTGGWAVIINFMEGGEPLESKEPELTEPEPIEPEEGKKKLTGEELRKEIKGFSMKRWLL